MTAIDRDTLRSEVHALDRVRGSSTEDAMWPEDDEDARANLPIEGMALKHEDDALFDMLFRERVPLPPATAILLKLLGHPDANLALTITQAVRVMALPDGKARLDVLIRRTAAHRGITAPCAAGRADDICDLLWGFESDQSH